MKKILLYFLWVLLSFGLVSCSTPEVEYNKPADYWYESMLNEIRFGNLEGADDRFASLQSEHINSPLIKEAMLILANAHMREKEYILAGFYFDEYLKRFGNAQNRSFITFMKLQANYYAFGQRNVNQQLLLDTIQETEDYISKYPTSPYREPANTLLINLYLASYALNQEVSRIYTLRDADFAAEFYEQKTPEWVRKIPAAPVHIPWYRALFDW